MLKMLAPGKITEIFRTADNFRKEFSKEVKKHQTQSRCCAQYNEAKNLIPSSYKDPIRFL